MVTDRRPTTKKKLGEGGNWGLPVEVGMSQKLILWLEYAYHAFPDVPYIMKGDDDTYLKVPQFLRDIRYIRGGYSGRNMEAPLGQRDPVGINETEECIYWGGYTRNSAWNQLPYHGGNGYMLHRRLVQVMLEDGDPYNADTVRLAVMPYDPSLNATYRSFLMDVEDMFVGKTLRDKRSRIREVCPFHRASYIEEPRDRLVDAHVIDFPIKWSGLLLHHVSPFDQYSLHYYFQKENVEASRRWVSGCVLNRAADIRSIVWMKAHISHNVTGYGRFAYFDWKHPAGVPQSRVSPGEAVRVYNLTYSRFEYDALDVAYKPVIPGAFAVD